LLVYAHSQVLVVITAIS